MSVTNVKEDYLQTSPGNKDVEPPTRQIAFSKYFTYLTPMDRLLLVVGTLAAVLAGAILPSISLVMGNVAAAFTTGGSNSGQVSIISQMSVIASIVMLIALSLFVFSYMFFAFWQHLAENITIDLRKRYIAALMHQEIAYFEINKVEQIPAQIAEIFDTVQASIGEKIANLIFAISTCLSGIIYAMVFGVAFAASCVAYLPILLMIIGVFGMQVKKSVSDKLNVVKQLGGIAEETLTAIKVVTSFGRE
jgi:ATP-binding cassette subfamily B (MDR/TAP) protein 1